MRYLKLIPTIDTRQFKTENNNLQRAEFLFGLSKTEMYR